MQNGERGLRGSQGHAHQRRRRTEMARFRRGVTGSGARGVQIVGDLGIKGLG
jgi:hypothetical protein